MPKTRLQELSEHGQSVWLDYLSRDILQNGKLAEMMDRDAVVGVTSNPTIFQKALAAGDAYDEQLKQLLELEDDLKEIFLALSAEDVKGGLELLRPVYDASRGEDGYVSWEVDPEIAYDRERTFEEAKRLHEWIDEPNLYVKIPATPPGVGAIEDSVAAGRNINVTLIFALQRHEEVMEAYVRGLERFAADGGDLMTRAFRRVVLRLARRHRSGQASRTGRSLGPSGKARDREREARVPELQARLLRRPLGPPRGEGCEPAALSLGVDVHEESRVPRRDVRRGADRPADREHDARGDDPGVPGSRRRRGHARARASTRRGGCWTTSARPASTTTT